MCAKCGRTPSCWTPPNLECCRKTTGDAGIGQACPGAMLTWLLLQKKKMDRKCAVGWGTAPGCDRPFSSVRSARLGMPCSRLRWCVDALDFALSHGCANHATEGEALQSPIHCCDVTNPPYLFSGEMCTSTLHCKRLLVYTVCFGAAVSAPLCSEHVTQTSYWRGGGQWWEKLRQRAVTQCATLEHPWFRPCVKRQKKM